MVAKTPKNYYLTDIIAGEGCRRGRLYHIKCIFYGNINSILVLIL